MAAILSQAPNSRYPRLGLRGRCSRGLTPPAAPLHGKSFHFARLVVYARTGIIACHLSKSVKKLKWIGSSYKDLKAFPLEVRRVVGYALYCAQNGRVHPRIKVLSGMGSTHIQEIRENGKSGTYRVIYTVEMADCVFVLLAFQKKSKSGIATPKQEMELLKVRLREVKALCKGVTEGKQ